LPIRRKALPIRRKALPIRRKALPIRRKALPIRRKALLILINWLSSHRGILPWMCFIGFCRDYISDNWFSGIAKN